ncbi:MAG: asparagine synthase (glutamine-hydrolyzing) [Flavobacterium sp.]
MCGIIGTTNQNISSSKFNEALVTINHRGPDNQSVYSDSNVIFGHTRLAIIDLDERSNQPFQYENNGRSLIVVFNGEIYNFLILKAELIDKGYLFKTDSDTEVLCAAYLEWGISCFDHFEGMWAVSIFDNQKEQLILSRDRMGKKPFYYSYDNSNVSFGSSLWGVSILSDQFEISSQGLQLYFALGFTPDTFSIIEGIHKLEPSKTIVFQKEQDKFTITAERNSVFKNKTFQNASVSKLFENAVLKRIISDVPIATLMSGGVDSTIVTSVTKKFHPETKTFFVDFDDKVLSEFYWANYLAQRNNIELNRIFLSTDDIFKSFSSYDEVYEEPFADYSGIPSIAIFNKVAKEFKVVLTGDGGDELFYGYPHYFKKHVLFTLLKVNKWFKIAGFFPQNIKQIIAGGKENFESNYLKNHAILTSFSVSYINKRFNSTIERANSFVRGIIQYDRDFNNLPEKYLVKVDRASMFSGIEVRSPFLDEALIEKTKKIPSLFLFTPFNTKLYLKILYFRFFGMKYFLSKKKGFTPPIKELRLTFFKENNFNQLKEVLQKINLELYNEIKGFTHEDLSKDSILFDRFFFFNLWYENYKKKVAQRNL